MVPKIEINLKVPRIGCGRIAHRQPLNIGDRQREARALQQRAHLAHVGKRRDAWRDAALDLGFRRGKGLTQLGQRIAAEQRREEKPIGFERAADLNERAWQIVQEMQRERGNHQVERAVAKRQRFLVGEDIGVRRSRGTKQASDRRGARKRAAQRIARGAEVNRDWIPAQHRAKPVREVGGDAIDEKCFDSKRAGARLAAAQQRAIENERVGHLSIVIAREGGRPSKHKPA